MSPEHEPQQSPDPMAPGQLRTLDEARCWELVSSGSVGRVVMVEGQRAEILPVNYVVSSGGIVFRTGAGGVLGRGASWGRQVAFEVDRIEPATQRGWSVVVQGELRAADTQEEQDLGAVVRPWVGGSKPVVATIRAQSITGRQIED